MDIFKRFLGHNESIEVSIDDVEQAVSENSAVIVDVREPDEWNAGHIASAIHIPLGELASRIEEIPVSGAMYTICRSGKRSITAIEILDQAGRPGSKSMAGGMIAWDAAGKPMVATGDAPAHVLLH